MFFGIVALVGSLLSPKVFLLMAVGYFVAYQLYYFVNHGLPFEPTWKAFMTASGGLLAYNLL